MAAMPRLRCAILDDYQHIALDAADWLALAGDVEVRAIHHHLRTEQEVGAEVGDCHIVVAMRERTPFPAPLFERLRHLQLLVTTGMRNRAIDIEAAAARGIIVCGTGSRAEPAAELTWALILGVTRHLVEEATALRSHGRWQSTVGGDLAGQTLGLLGLGRIGERVARIGTAFDMNVVAWSEHLTRDRTDSLGVTLARSKDDLLAESDYVSIHLVHSDRTHRLIGADDLRRMKRSAYLINTSRGAIVDEAALAEALQERWIAGAGVDVFEEEPLPNDHPFRSLPNLLATPHLGYVTRGNYRTFYSEAIEDIQAFLRGAPIRVLSA
jgi:phosphoglycerate dehydrogenase-like enzyme